MQNRLELAMGLLREAFAVRGLACVVRPHDSQANVVVVDLAIRLSTIVPENTELTQAGAIEAVKNMLISLNDLAFQMCGDGGRYAAAIERQIELEDELTALKRG